MDEVDGMAGNEDRGGIQVVSSCFIKVWSRRANGFGTRPKFMQSLKNIKDF